MNLEERLNFMTHGVLRGKEHLETLYGDLNENLESLDVHGKEFVFGHLTGMMEVLRFLLEEHVEDIIKGYSEEE